MKRFPPLCKLPVYAPLLGVLLCLFALPLAARTVVMDIDRLATSLAQLADIELTLDWPDGAAQGRFSFVATSLDTGEMGYRWRDLAWQCDLQKIRRSGWQCAGDVHARGTAGMALSARLDADALVVEMSGARSRLAVKQARSDGAPLQIELARVPVVWLEPLIAQAWKEGRPTGGEFNADWKVETGDDGVTFGGPLSFAALGLDSQDGTIAAEGLGATGQLHATLAEAHTAFDLTFDLNGGEMLFGPMYMSLPESPVHLAMRMSSASEGKWQVSGLRWQDPGVLDVSGQLSLDLGAEGWLSAAKLQADLPALGKALPRYFESLADSAGLSGIAASGALQTALDYRDGGWHTIDSHLDDVNVEDGEGRFGISGLAGDLRLRRGEEAAASALSWQGAHMHGLGIGSSGLRLLGSRGGVNLQEPVAMPMLGGVLHLKSLRYMPDEGGDDMQLDVSLSLRDLSLTELSSAFDWPPFGGTISGDLPGIRYVDEQLFFDGGLVGEVFDGQINVSRLTMARPFGVAPMLAASIEFSDLDLEPLTGAFGFGEITGRLDGHILGLRLLDWEPVAFDAAFHTVKRSGVRRRISQRAVRELTEVGGGGIAAGLQTQVLKAFSSFGYSRIGLSCVLVNNVCTMGGVEPAENGGYIIVDGSGLPRVSVIGHQQQVDWPVLVSRLKTATEGKGPIVD